MGGSQLLASGHFLFSMSSISCFDTCLCGSTGPQKFSHDDRVFILSQQFLSVQIIFSEHTREKSAKKGQRDRLCCRKEKKKTIIEYVSIQHFYASEMPGSSSSKDRGGLPLPRPFLCLFFLPFYCPYCPMYLLCTVFFFSLVLHSMWSSYYYFPICSILTLSSWTELTASGCIMGRNGSSKATSNGWGRLRNSLGFWGGNFSSLNVWMIWMGCGMD